MRLGIRKYKKDHLKELAPTLVAIPAAVEQSNSEDPLRFWTKHSHPILVELSVFALGDQKTIKRSGRFRGGFSGRPQLIAELAPVLKPLMEYLAPRSCKHYLQALRDWWHLLDGVEEVLRQTGTNFERVLSVSQITELHRQRAYDQNMDRCAFGNILTAINIVRKHRGLRQLHWQRPEEGTSIRHLPPEWQTRKLRIALKHGWFRTLRRWERADELIEDSAPSDSEEERLQRNYILFQKAIVLTGHPRPPASSLCGDMTSQIFSKRGYSVAEMLKGRYPDAEDIRYAFHLCLANTGWNAAVFLSLNANEPFIEPHPKDPTRYLLRGYKARARSEQMTEGMYKSKGSAGVILQTLMHRTEPLRAYLRKELSIESARLEQMMAEEESREVLDEQRKRVVKLSEGVSSVWLYVTSKNEEILWLDQHCGSYIRGLHDRDKSNFLDWVIGRINSQQPEDRQLSPIKASDFRDAFAAYAYRISGGMVLYVMKVLGHKSLQSTQRYLDNTLLNEQSVELYQTFSNSLWSEIKLHGRLDPTIIAHYSRHGITTPEHRERLNEYRDLSRSRIGVGCKDPAHPPKRIAPNFRPDGKAKCHVHRCMLCLEHAVVFPDSGPGLCKRLAELRFIQSRMSIIAFEESSFGEEMTNIEVALQIFDPAERDKNISEWEGRIQDGRHFVIDLDGLHGMHV